MKRHNLTIIKKLAFVLSLLFFTQMIALQTFAQTANRWYVDKNAKGTGTGRIIENAWASFSAINWASLSNGDTLFISGGADSTVYNETLTIGKANITIARMNTPGHNGKVIIDGQNNLQYGILNQTSSYDNVTIDGLDKTKFIIRNFTSQGIRFRYNTNCALKNFTIELNYPTAFSGVFLYGSEWTSPPSFAGKYIVQNFSILQDSGSYSGGGNSDGMQIGGVDSLIIQDGYISLWNADGTPHQDGIQVYHSKNVTIERNQIIHKNAGATSNRQGIYITDSGGKIKIRNNYIWLRENATGSAIAYEIYDNIWWTMYATGDSIQITNNTINCDYDIPNAIRLVQSLSSTTFSANVLMKNNIFVKGNFAIDRKYFTSVANCDYNNYYDATVNIYEQISNTTGSSRNWSTWQSYGFDTHSYITDPKLVGYKPSVLDNVDKGIDLSNLGYTRDIEGRRRTSGQWSIGAYQYSTSSDTTVETPKGNVKVNLRVILQGPYNGTVMLTALSESELIPDSQPYNISPWNYAGDEKINSVPTTMVDWVLVELRDGSNPTKIVARRAGILRNDGILLETDGTSGINFSNILYGSYYIAVRHRNHLAVMSSSPVLLSPNNDLYDFTTSGSKAYGQDAETNFGNGVYCMYAGDGDGNGVINDDDRNNVWSDNNGSIGYLDGDFNLDSGVTVKDINNFWNVNDNKVTQVP